MENQNNLSLNEQAVDALRESAKWSTFLAVLGFIGIGFMVLAALFMSSVASLVPDNNPYGSASPFGAMKGFISIFYAIMAAIYFLPIYYLFKYASEMKNALMARNSEMVSNALVYLKSHHKFLGIMMIVLISLYIIIIIGMIVFFASMAGSRGL